MMSHLYVDAAQVMEAVGFESMAQNSAVGGTNDAITASLGEFERASNAKCLSILQQHNKPVLDSAYADEEMKKKDYWLNMSATCSRVAKDYVKYQAKFNSLPTDVQRSLKPLAKHKVALESSLAKMSGEKNSKRYFATKFKLDQCTNAMESVLFSHLANLQTRRIANGGFTNFAGLESYSYQNAIFYPKLEAMTQWVNTAACIYPKVTKIKQLINEISSVPVHTQEIYVVFKDQDNREVRRVLRQELYNTMTADDYPEAYQTFTRKLTLNKKDFGKDLMLKTTILDGMTEPFCGPNEILRSDIYVADIILEDGTHLGKIFDPKAGLMEGETFNEMDWKGKMVKIVPDFKHPEKYYYVSGMFDGSFHQLVFTQSSKSDSSMSDIASIVLEFKIHDIYMEQKANTEFQIVERRGFVQAGAVGRLDIPLIQSELDIIDQRTQGNFLNKITNLASEYITHAKDKRWYEGYMAMRGRVIEAYNNKDQFALYGIQEVDMNIPGQVNKEEAFNVYLGAAFDVLKEKLNVTANSQTDVQLNLFTHSLHLPVIKKLLTHVSGEVTEETNGKFLGVAQDNRVHVISVGSDEDPVNSIVVGSDKSDLMVKVDRSVAPQDIEYPYWVVPTYKETNIETTLFVETPTRVLADNAFRSNNTPYTPAMFMEYTGDFKVLRGSAADVKVKGYHTRAVK